MKETKTKESKMSQEKTKQHMKDAASIALKKLGQVKQIKDKKTKDDYKRMSLAELQKKAKEGYFELYSDPKPRNYVEVKYPNGKKEWVFVEDSKPTAKDGMGDYEVVYSE